MKRAAGLAVFSAMLLAAASAPASPWRLDAFRRIVVLEQGRPKPLDTYARSLLQRFSGHSALPGLDASAWLARVLFTPRASLGDKVFLVDRPDVLASIGLGDAGRGRYSFDDLRPGLNRLHRLAVHGAGAERQGRFEAEVQRLFANVSSYYALLDAFAFARADGAITGATPRGPAILPPAAGPDRAWLGPAEVLSGDQAPTAAMRREIEWLSQACRAYAANDEASFERFLAGFDRALRERLGPRAVPPRKVSLEIFYNRLDPFLKARLAYGLALLLLLLSLAFRRRLLERLSFLALLAGFLLHGGGLLLRILITGRPPVTNLYETFVFVAWAAAGLGMVMARLQRSGLGLLAGGLAGLAFLVIAGRYGLDGDTMGMLAAVLDSNLWLATHVVTIALGYAGCLVAGIIGHAVLIQEIRGRRAAAGTVRSLYAVLAFGLIFTCIGTLMGGIWADLSWGRFWGWDPKENGALLIILWCAALFHARRAGWIGRIGLAAGAVGAGIAVALVWLGVNLLGVGLHSYGFTSGAARGLLAFVTAELAFLAVAVPLALKKGGA
ncbi:MAG: cytochrome c biogenesis protein CcsA [Candidatus Aminicenantes bacterium]|nr:cytochrome c biogenesis protein CcsA [Candidatus Aminicenantes bacterium]